MRESLTIGFLAGRWDADWATEKDYAKALRKLGHEVVELDERAPIPWFEFDRFDVVLWMTARADRSDLASAALRDPKRTTPVVGIHLDRWWGLRRERDIAQSPFFAVDLLCTADGGSDERWAERGIKHRWLLPAVDADAANTEGRVTERFRSPLAFVGSWAGYHAEWPHRFELVRWLRDRYPRDFMVWPQRYDGGSGKPIRGQDLANLCASASIIVGDSCMVGPRYISDRLPELIGRGAFLLHPDVEGVTGGEHYRAGLDLGTWPVGNWSALEYAIDGWLADAEGRELVRKAGRAHVLAHHTYDVRAAQLLAMIEEEGLL